MLALIAQVKADSDRAAFGVRDCAHGGFAQAAGAERRDVAVPDDGVGGKSFAVVCLDAGCASVFDDDSLTRRP